MIDGPFSVTTALNDREGVKFRSSTVAYRRAGASLSQIVERYDATEWQRRRGVTRLTSTLRAGGAFRLEGFAQYLTGQWSGRQALAERAFQAGFQTIATPAPNLAASGSFSYLKDWASPAHDQAVANLRLDWWRGQLTIRFDGELQEDLGRDNARGRFTLTLLRQF
jgi:hypothetical protein